MNQKYSDISNKGFALTEVLLSIAVIVIIGIATYPLYKNAQSSSKVENMANDIAIIQANTRQVFAGQNGYKRLGSNGLQMMASLGMVPDELKSDDPTWFGNVWGGRMTLDTSLDTGTKPIPAGSGFSIMVTGMPVGDCVKLGIRLAPSFVGIGTTDSAGDIKGDIGNMGNQPPKPLDLDALNSACSNPQGYTKEPTLYFTST